MTTTFRTMSGQSFALSSSISSTQTTITLSSFLVPVSGTAITMATMGTSIAYGTLAPGTSSAELISFTGVTQNSDGTATLTGVSRGLDKEYPYASSSTFKQPHAGQTIFILSDAPQVFNEMGALKNDNIWTGQQTFPQSGSTSAALVGTVYAAPTQDTEVASKKYVDTIAVYGAPLATTGVAGIVELPTETQVEAGTQTGGTGAQLALPNKSYGARFNLGSGLTTGTPNAYAVTLTPTPVALATGNFVGITSSFTNTGNSTINVNGLGAKNIQLGSTGLFSGAITTNSVVGMVYNGTSFDTVYRSDGVTTSATGNKIPLRLPTGDITVTSLPTNSTDAASKNYVDTHAGILSQSTTPITSSVLDTNENTMATISIAGGILGTTGAIRIVMNGTWAGSTGGRVLTLKLKYGGNTAVTIAATDTTTSANGNFTWTSIMYAAGATNSQKTRSLYQQSATVSTLSPTGNQFFITSSATTATDSTAVQNLLLTSQLNSTSNPPALTIDNYYLEIV